MNEEALQEMGPVDYMVVEWPDKQPTGEAAPLLIDLVDRGLIRILDLAFIVKGEDGIVSRPRDREGRARGRGAEGPDRGVLGADQPTRTWRRRARRWIPAPPPR